MSPSSRRTALRTLGLAVLPVAGCVESTPVRSNETGSPERTDTTTNQGPVLQPGDRYETDDQRSLRLVAPDVHRSVVTTEEVSSTHVYEVVSTAVAGQYLVVTASVSGVDERGLSELPVTVAVDGHIGTERTVIEAIRHGSVGRDGFAFRLPVVDAEEVTVVWAREDGPRPRWRLGEDIAAKLGAAPAFELRSLDLPDEVSYGEPIEASFTVANVGERDGRFLAEFGPKQGSLGVGEVSTEVPAGTEETYETPFSPHYYEEIGSVRIVLDWGAGHRERTVEVTEPETRESE